MDGETTRKSILDAAAECVCEDRNLQYGEPEDTFAVIAELWTSYLSARCVPPGVRVNITAEEVGMMMVLFKVGRQSAQVRPGMDTYVDIAGYAACAGDIACRGVEVK